MGMYPRNCEKPIDLDQFPKCEGVADLIYNPEKTALILQAEQKGIAHTGGLYMLVAQGAKASEYFLRTKYDDSVIERVYNEVNTKMRNIVLVGMPGCGKSSVGRALARILERPFVDSDDYITETEGRTPAQIIEQDGVESFRKIESAALCELTKCSGIVLATGGGVVTVPENYGYLRQNGRVFFIERNVARLATAGRPLSAGGAERLKAMYEARLPLYLSVSDHTVKAEENCGAETTAKKIIDRFFKSDQL